MRKPIATVAALVFNPEAQLLLLRSPKWGDRWALPAGKVEYGESLEAAVRREVEEETGLVVERFEPLKLQEIIRPQEFEQEAHFISQPFLARTTRREVHLNHEATEAIWVTKREALDLPLNQPTRELISALAEPDGVIQIDRLVIPCIVGILPHEREQEQDLVVTLELDTNIRVPALTQSLEDTVDYAALAQEIRVLVQQGRYELLESLVEDVATALLTNPLIARVRVRAEKPAAIPAASAAVVEIVRDKRGRTGG